MRLPPEGEQGRGGGGGVGAPRPRGPGIRALEHPSLFQLSGFRFRVSGIKFRVSGFGFQVPDFGRRVSTEPVHSRTPPCFSVRASGFGFRVSDIRASSFGFQISGISFWVSCFGIRGCGDVIREPVHSSTLTCFVFRVSGFGFLTSGVKFRVLSFGLQVSPKLCTIKLSKAVHSSSPRCEVCGLRVEGRGLRVQG